MSPQLNQSEPAKYVSTSGNSILGGCPASNKHNSRTSTSVADHLQELLKENGSNSRNDMKHLEEFVVNRGHPPIDTTIVTTEKSEDPVISTNSTGCPYSSTFDTRSSCPFSQTTTTVKDTCSTSLSGSNNYTRSNGGCPVLGKPHSSFAESWAYLQETVQREFPPKSADVITTADQLLQFIEQARFSSAAVLHPDIKCLSEEDNVSDDVSADNYPKEEIEAPQKSESKVDTTITEQVSMKSSSCPFLNNHKSTNGLSCPFSNKQVTTKGCPFSSQKQEPATATTTNSSNMSSVDPKDDLTTRQGGCPVIGKSHSNFSKSWAYLQETLERDFPTKSSNIISTAEQLQQFIEQSRMLSSNYKEQGEIVIDEQIPERNASSRLVSSIPKTNHHRQDEHNAQQTDTNGLSCPFSKKRVDNAKGSSSSCPFSNAFANPASGCPVLMGPKHTSVADALAHLRRTVELNCPNNVASDHITTAEQLQAALALVTSENDSKEESNSFSFSPFGHRQEELD